MRSRYVKADGPGMLMGAAVACGLLLLLASVLSTDPVMARVVGHEWSMSLDVEEYKTFTRKGKRVPQGGRALRSWTESERDYNALKGKWERGTVTYYEYETDEWSVVEMKSSSGVNRDPYWPEAPGVQPDTGEPPRIGRRRLGTQRETYSLVLQRVEGEQVPLRFETADAALWLSYVKEQQVVADVNAYGTVRGVRRPQENE